jgi:hypothetical protein
LAHYEFGDQTIECLAAARTWLSQRGHWSGADVMDVLMARLGPRIAVEKSPENVESAATLRRLSAAYPRARYLHLTRHPITAQASMARHLLTTLPDQPRLGQPMTGVAAWYRAHARILRFTARLPGHRVIRLRAEDVLNDTSAQLRAIAGWLRLRTDDAAIEAMRHPEGSPFARLGPPESGVVGGHDHGFLRDPVPRPVELPPAVELPTGWHGENYLWQRMVELARQLGYGDWQSADTRQSRRTICADDPEELRKELLRRRDTDLAARSAYAGAPAQMARLMELDEENTAWLKVIVEQAGWPGHSLVGEHAAHAAWLLAQHADLDPAFQRRCLTLLREAVALGEGAPADLAHLTDRVLLASGEPQLYGTQVGVHDGHYAPTRLHDPESVDARRAAMGLDPLGAHLGRVLDRQGPPRPTQGKCPACGESIPLWLPDAGEATRFKCEGCGATGTIRARAQSGQHCRADPKSARRK